MPTKTLRERFEQFEDDREYHLFDVDKNDYLAFIETLLEEARQETKEKCVETLKIKSLEEINGPHFVGLLMAKRTILSL